MELRRAADALLRSQSSPLPAFLTPSISRWHPQCRQAFNSINVRQSQRTFSACTTYAATRPSDTPSSPEPAEPAKPAKPAESNPEDIASSLNWIKAGMGGNRTSRFASRNAQAEKRSTVAKASSLSDELLMNKGSSASDLLRSVNIGLGVRSSTFNIDKMKDPAPRFDAASLMRDVSHLTAPAAPKPQLRLNPQTGRTISIGAGVDVGRGFRMLEQTCNRNSVKKDLMRQRYHERPGLKRKRLRRERWRKRFMEGFRATVVRVKELRKQGW